jgi:hypothetical protein
VLVLTMFDDDSVFSAMRAGARGYVLKGAEQEIARTITAVAAGEAIFGPAVATRVLAYFASPPRTPTPFPDLTTREREVLDLIAAIFAKLQVAVPAPATVPSCHQADFPSQRAGVFWAGRNTRRWNRLSGSFSRRSSGSPSCSR